MLKEERLSKIVDLVNEYKTIKTTEIAEILEISLATVRRDLNELSQSNSIKKIFGGAKSLSKKSYVTSEEDMIQKNKHNMLEKNEIGKYAARLIEDDDFVYMDAGTSVEAIVPYITAKGASFVTNSIGIARELATLKYKVFILPGEVKLTTDSITGIAASEYLKKFNFKLGFFGTNGIDELGFTTPDINEAIVKREALKRCLRAYVVSDHSKFGKVSQVTFWEDLSLEIITDKKEKDGSIKVQLVKVRSDK